MELILVLLLGHINPIQSEMVDGKRTEGCLLVIDGIAPKLLDVVDYPPKQHIHLLVHNRSREARTLNSSGQEISRPNDQHHPCEQEFQAGQKWGKQREAT